MKNMKLTTFLALAFFFLSYFRIDAQQITGFDLINAQTDVSVGEIAEGSSFNTTDIGSQLNIRANTSGSIGSVKFWLDGAEQKTEGAAPYAMFGDESGDFLGGAISIGNHEVKATAFSGAGAAGEVLSTLSVTFVLTESIEDVVHPADSGTGEVEITGELKKWHKITLSFDGPAYSETSTPTNPFLDFKFDITFTKGSKSYVVPGYFAADGNAAETSADSGNVWRVHFAPDEIGEWTYKARFYIGKNVAVANAFIGVDSLPPIHGKTGSFIIAASDKTGNDNRAKGRLQYVGEHHLRYAQTGEYFMKGGADAPENFLAYSGFDGEFKTDGIKDDLIKDWAPHIKDWREGDPLWKATEGKGIVGAINYLASEGLNVFSFLTMNINGDDRNVYPYVKSNDFKHFDCSKLDQWEIVFNHADTLGMYLHFKTQETENDQLLDGGDVGTLRKMYYRELIARFGHHLALNWNMGEENTQTVRQRKNMAQFFYENDPYRHNVVIHTFPNVIDEVYGSLVGNQSLYTGISIQTEWNHVYSNTNNWVKKSAESGRKWVVANDEQGSANIGVPEDAYTGTPNKHDIRQQTLWGNLMAGGAGVEYYFGYQRPESDLNCQNYRSRDESWDYVRYALSFFKEYVKFWEMQAHNDIVSNGWCLAKEGEMYVVYLKEGGTTNIQIRDTSSYYVKWFDPRNGGELLEGSITSISGRGENLIGNAPNNPDKDWVVLIQRNVAGLPKPTAIINADTTQGEVGLTVTFSSLSIGAQSLYWYFGNGQEIAQQDSLSLHKITYNQTGNYQVVLVATNKYGVSAFDYQTINVVESNKVFEEQDGELLIEAEDLTLVENWKRGDEIDGAFGGQYIFWTGNEYFNNASNGQIHADFIINNPGTYRFDWRVAIGNGDSGTEHNDSWLKIKGNDFFGYRSNNTSFIHPKPLCQSSNYGCPEGASVDGFFKLFGGKLNNFVWKAVTSDNSDHKIYVVFQEAGQYSLIIAARSSYHCIDRLTFTKTTEVPVVNAVDIENRALSIYPNPANKSIYVESNALIDYLEIVNLAGNTVLSMQEVDSKLIQIDTDALPAGLYFVIVKKTSGELLKEKLVIQK